jgi:beta-lactamase regulating signal transducer with metallopeptidase domain
MTMSGFLLLLVKVNLAMGAAIVLVSLIRRPLRAQFGAPIAYAIWLLVPIASVTSLLPPREVPAPAHVASFAPAAPAPVTGYVPHSTLGAIGQPARQSVPMPPAPMKPPRSSHELFDISRLLFSAWVLGLLFMAAYLARVQLRFSAAVRRGEAGPAVLGFFRPRIVTPADFQGQFTPQEQSAILAHERVHLARQDARINALAAFLRCFCWFNPLIHLGARRLRIDQELACDAIAVSGAISRRDYATALLKSQLMVGVLPFGCNWPGPQHPLVERVALLQRKPPGAARRLAGMSLVLLTAASAGLGAWAAQPPVAAQSVTAPRPGIARATLPAIGAAQDRTNATATANPTGSGGDVDASKNAPATEAASAAPVVQAKASPDPVTTTNAQSSIAQTLPPVVAPLPTNQVAANQAAQQAFQNEVATSAGPATQLPAAAPPVPKEVDAPGASVASNDPPTTPVQPLSPAMARNDQPVSPIQPVARNAPAGAAQAVLSTPPAAPPVFDPNKPYSKKDCASGPVSGRVISSTAIQTPHLACGSPGGGSFAETGGGGLFASGSVSGSPGVSFNSGPCKKPVRWTPSSIWGRYCPNTPNTPWAIMNVQLANPADAGKMPPGKVVTVSGDFSVITQNKVQYWFVKNARVLYADPFGR